MFKNHTYKNKSALYVTWHHKMGGKLHLNEKIIL